jgi:hypothetical protein
MRNVSRSAFAKRHAGAAERSLFEVDRFCGRIVEEANEQGCEPIHQGEEQHRERQIECRVEIDHQPRRRRLDLCQQPGDLRKQRQHEDATRRPYQQIAERKPARGGRADLEEWWQRAAEIGTEHQRQ